jgi:hypothetical protein
MGSKDLPPWPQGGTAFEKLQIDNMHKIFRSFMELDDSLVIRVPQLVQCLARGWTTGR